MGDRQECRSAIGVMVLNYNGTDLTLGAVTSVLSAGFLPGDVTVVDNGSRQATVEELRRQLPPGVDILRIEENDGIPRALNAGINRLFAENTRLSSALVVMNDVRLVNTDVEALHDALAEPRVAAVAPVQCRSAQPEVVHTAGGRLDKRYWLTSHWRNGTRYDDLPTSLPPSDYLDTSCILVSREAWDLLGQFRADFRLYWEDVEWSIRAREAGWQVRVVRTPCLHSVGGTMGTGVSKIAIARSAHNRWALQKLTKGLGARRAVALIRELARLFGGRRRASDALLNLTEWSRVYLLNRGPGAFRA